MASLSSTQIFGDLFVNGQIKNIATTETEGVVKLNDTVSSTSTTEAATANAVKTAYDKANHAHPYAATTHTHNYAASNHSHNTIICTDITQLNNFEGLTVADTNSTYNGYESNYTQVLNIKSASGTTQIINETEWEEPILKVRQRYLTDNWGPFYKIYHSGSKPTPAEIGAFKYEEHADGTSLDTAFETGTHWLFHATGTLPAGYTTDNDFVLQSFRSGITNKSWQVQFLYDMRASRTFTRRQKNEVFEAWTELTSGNFLPLTGGTLTSDLEFSNNEIGSTKGVIGTVGDNDFWRIVGGSTASNSGYLEIATADDGTEPIYVRQYSSGKFITLARTATLLDSSGNTSFPGTVTATAFTGALNGNASTATTLQTARTINGVAFNGSANITIQDSTKLALSGGTLSGALNFANATLNKVGDDAYLGDNNVAGCVCIKGNNASTGLTFIPYSGSVTQTLRIDGSNTMTLNGNFRADAEIQSTAANAFRAAYGNYGFFIRQDGANTYFMFTDAGNPYGNWNGLRPITLSNSTGNVSIGHSLTIGDSNGNVKRTTISTANPSGGTNHDVWIKY